MRLSGNIVAAFMLIPSPTWAQDLTAKMIEGMGNNTLFTRWRPQAHFSAPAGWMNDPCGSMYDPHTETYHLLYQWHPNHVEWGNISWGHAVSKDLITWTDIRGWRNDKSQALGTGKVGTYNGLGIFSGTAQPVSLQGKNNGDLSIFYTSVQHLPTSWDRYYIPHTETWSAAVSHDGGDTWEEYSRNPIVRNHPRGWNVTGWRDPFVLPIPELDKLLKRSEPHYYSVLGSGIKGVGPRIPLYSAPKSDLTDWTFLGALWEPSMNTSLGSPIETGTYGFNFEVSGFFTLPDSAGRPHYFVNMGTEGGQGTFHPSSHWALWNGGTVHARANGSVEFKPSYGGAGDWGLLYALTSFWDKKNDRRVQWGWAPEDNNDLAVKQNGYQGCMAFPRHLFVHEVDGVVPSKHALSQHGNSKWERSSEYGAYKATTLGVRPLPEVVEALRKSSKKTTYQGGMLSKSKKLGKASSQKLELKATFQDVKGQAGFTIATSDDGKETTTVKYNFLNHTVVVDRSRSSQIKNFADWSVNGYFEPYTRKGGDKEPIHMDLFLDGSLLELYINGRFALTTRIYPGKEDSNGFGIFIGEASSAKVSDVTAWKGLMNIWPDRPLDSSSPLEYDTAEETNDYTWWAGY